MNNVNYKPPTPLQNPQLEAIITRKNERIDGLVAERKALWGKLLEYICDNDIRDISQKAIKEVMESCR